VDSSQIEPLGSAKQSSSDAHATMQLPSRHLWLSSAQTSAFPAAPRRGSEIATGTGNWHPLVGLAGAGAFRVQRPTPAIFTQTSSSKK